MTRSTTEDRVAIRHFIQANMDAFYDGEELADTDNIFEMGFVGSLFAMQLLQFIEKEFEVQVADEDIILEHFSSVENMLGLVDKLRGGSYAS
jgi:methoxymalonate biosynthesis acyl carrier protein